MSNCFTIFTPLLLHCTFIFVHPYSAFLIKVLDNVWPPRDLRECVNWLFLIAWMRELTRLAWTWKSTFFINHKFICLNAWNLGPLGGMYVPLRSAHLIGHSLWLPTPLKRCDVLSFFQVASLYFESYNATDRKCCQDCHFFYRLLLS